MVWFFYYKTANCTGLCGAMWLSHFVGGFGAVFAICAVHEHL